MAPAATEELPGLCDGRAGKKAGGPPAWLGCACCGEGLARAIRSRCPELAPRDLDAAEPSAPSCRRLRFLSRWARLQLGTVEIRSHAHGLVQHQRPIVDQVIVAGAPWGRRLHNGAEEEEACKHLGIVVRFLQKTGIAETVRATNGLSAREWAEPRGTLEVAAESALRTWHSQVLPTLAALARMRAPAGESSGAWEVPGEACLELAEWSARFLEEHPTRKGRSFFRLPSQTPRSPIRAALRFGRQPSLQAEQSFRSCVSDGSEGEDLVPPNGAENEIDPASDSEEGEAIFQSFLSVRSGSGLFSLLQPGAAPGPASWDFRRGSEEHGWDEADATAISVRSATFLEDKVKAEGRPAIFEVVQVDLFDVEEPGGLPHVSAAPAGVVQELRRAGEGRFLFVVNFCMAPLQLAVVFAERGVAAGAHLPAEGGDPAKALFRRFVEEMDDEERSSRFKVIPWVRDGPWIVQKAVGRTPTIIGRKLKVRYFQQPGDHFEVSVDIFSSAAAQRILSLLKGAARGLAMEVFFVLEGREHEELPERILGGFRVSRGDLTRTRGPL